MEEKEESNQRLKVAILTTSFPAYEGDVQSPFIYELAKKLQKKTDVEVICPYYSQSKSQTENWDGIKIQRYRDFLKLTSGGGIPSNLSPLFISKVSQLFIFLTTFYFKAKNCQNSNVIHAQWALSGLVGACIKKKNQGLILTTRGAALNLASKNKFMKKWLIWALNKCDHLTPNNEEHKKQLLSLGIPEEKITVIPNGIDSKKFSPGNKLELRKELDIPSDKKIILFVGWLIKRKGCEYLLRAMQEIISQEKNVKLIVMGEGILRKDLENLAIELGIQQYVDFIGTKSPGEVPKYMKAADLFVLPSLSEGRPNVVGEAMACELPVIATDVNGTPDFIDDGENGFLIPVKDPKAIFEKLQTLLNDPELRKKFGKKSRKSIEDKKLSWENCAKTYIDIYNKVLKNK